MGTFEEERALGLDGPDWNTSHGLWLRFLVAAITTFVWTIQWIRMDLYGTTIAQIWGTVGFFGVSRNFDSIPLYETFCLCWVCG